MPRVFFDPTKVPLRWSIPGPHQLANPEWQIEVTWIESKLPMSDLMSSHDLFQVGQFSPAAKKRGNAHLKVWTEHVLDERCISEDLEGPAVNPSKAQKYDASEVLWLTGILQGFLCIQGKSSSSGAIKMGYLISRKTGGEAEAPSSPTNFSFFFTSKFGAASRTWEIVASIIKATHPQGNWSTCCLNFMLMFLLQHRLQSCIINMFTIFLVKFVIIQPSHLFLVIFRVIISSELQLTCKVKTFFLCTLYIYIIISISILIIIIISFIIIIINYYCYLLLSLLLLLWWWWLLLLFIYLLLLFYYYYYYVFCYYYVYIYIMHVLLFIYIYIRIIYYIIYNILYIINYIMD